MNTETEQTTNETAPDYDPVTEMQQQETLHFAKFLDKETEVESLVKCDRCGRLLTRITRSESWPDVGLCRYCAAIFPAALLKSLVDPFDYALRLKTGETVRFIQAEVFGVNFVHLKLMGSESAGLPFSFPRGIDVRLSDIVWCADAPEGS